MYEERWATIQAFTVYFDKFVDFMINGWGYLKFVLFNFLIRYFNLISMLYYYREQNNFFPLINIK